MKLVKFISVFIVLSTLVFVLAHLLYTWSFRAVEQYPNDTQLEFVGNKTALVMVAHDDEASTFAGTVAYLRERGWTVDFLCFYLGEHTPLEALRKSESSSAASIQQFRNVDLVNLNMQRKPLPFYAIPYADFEEYFYIDSISAVIKSIILKSNPSVLLTLDDEIGGYGHSEHVLVGKLARKMALEINADGLGAIEYIYQCVYPATMADRMMSTQPIYKISQQIYQVDGMPEASVEIPIYKYSKEKMATIRSYASQHRNLKKFVKHYHLYPHWIYFRVFDKEFFRIIQLK